MRDRDKTGIVCKNGVTELQEKEMQEQKMTKQVSSSAFTVLVRQL